LNNRNKLNNVIKRRIQFLITEVNSKNPTYDKSISMLMRLVSNFATIGEDGDSKKVKIKNRNISVNAKKLRDAKSLDEFHDLTINEHQLPLKDLWDWCIKEKKTLNTRDVWNKFCDYPFITITKEENLRLNKIKREKLTPELRYQKAGITIVRL
jgi:hypothetical protein